MAKWGEIVGTVPGAVATRVSRPTNSLPLVVLYRAPRHLSCFSHYPQTIEIADLIANIEIKKNDFPHRTPKGWQENSPGYNPG